MTPAIKALQKAKAQFRIHEYRHAPGTASYGQEAAEKLGVAPQRVFKTLVVAFDNGSCAVAVVPVNAQLGMKQIARAAGAKKAAMAEGVQVQRLTGYVLGGVSPIAQKRRLRTFIDSTAQQFDTIFVSAGRRGLEIELRPQALQRQTHAQFTDLAVSD
ncbi:Cys-tRNA(Pro) deacylase [Microbulbifer sp. SAOS-129_SWC]|uniref:Cys-tRNA(Pro) deacylase n=1 Tax=Microbulbifer sp. SAOS-129_SWC TaxID=3145235 RepID=UPI003216B2BB